jgi:hypothetical protein
VSVFEADDLVLRKNELWVSAPACPLAPHCWPLVLLGSLVANTILKLARLAVKFGVQAPLIVQ